MTTRIDRVGVIGAGAWGTALAQLAAENGCAVRLWSRTTETAESFNRERRHPRYPGLVHLHAAIRATADLDEAADADALVLAVPAQASRAALEALGTKLPVVLAAKGIERGTGLTQSEILRAVAPEATAAVLSGPGFAEDIARGLPTAVTLAVADETLGRALVATLGRPSFRPYLSTDLTGVELGGAVKNVLAIAAGAVAGRGLGASAGAALVARGFAEMTRFGVASGARAETLAGLSGLGDLVLTCGSPMSRNRAFGEALGKGLDVASALAASRGTVEGAASAPVLVEKARERGVEMPIAEAVAAVLDGRLSLDEAVDALLARPFRAEL